MFSYIENKKIIKEAVTLRNLYTIYCFAILKLTQYIVAFTLSGTALF